MKIFVELQIQLQYFLVQRILTNKIGGRRKKSLFVENKLEYIYVNILM